MKTKKEGPATAATTAATVSGTGTTVTTIALADGDPSNEIESVGKILYHLTDFETALKINESGQLIAGEFESGVCA